MSEMYKYVERILGNRLNNPTRKLEWEIEKGIRSDIVAAGLLEDRNGIFHITISCDGNSVRFKNTNYGHLEEVVVKAVSKFQREIPDGSLSLEGFQIEVIMPQGNKVSLPKYVWKKTVERHLGV